MEPIPTLDGLTGNADEAAAFMGSVLAASTEYSMIVTDPDGLIRLWNEGAGRLYGYAASEILGQSSAVLHNAEDKGRGLPSEIRVAALREGKWAGTVESVRQDGSQFMARVVATPRSAADGTEGGFLLISSDISEQVRVDREVERARAHSRSLIESDEREADREREVLEAQLNQLRRLESVGQLAGGIAHDFNNVLGIILNYAQFVADDIGETSPVYADVQEIRRAAERAAALTRQLLIFSRREVARSEVLDLNRVVSGLERLLGRALGEHVQLEIDLGSELWSVQADPGQIEQILVNLAVNARDAMTAGGSLLIKTRNAEIGDKRGAMAPGRYVQLAVSDTGSGMAQEVQAHAFEPFFTTKPRGEATGLGLSTVYGIVTEAGGTIQLSSDPGHGTIVQIYLPATTATPGTAVPVEDAAPEGAAEGGETVLVVEDEDAIRRVAERILSSAGYRVITVSGKDAALDACQNEETIDLLLTDVVMPGLLGPELVAHATRVRPGVKVLYMSGYIHQMTEHLGHAHEDFGFVAKPFTADTLLTGVREALDAS